MDSSKKEAARKKIWDDDTKHSEKKKDSHKSKDHNDSERGRERDRDDEHKTKKRREPEKDEEKLNFRSHEKITKAKLDDPKKRDDEKETKKVKFDEKKDTKSEKKTTSEVIKLPRELARAETTFKIVVSNGEAKLVHSSGDYISRQAVDYCMNKHVFERPVWPSKRDSTTKNPDIGALIARWVKKTSSEKKKNSSDEEKGKKKVFIKFADVGEETQKKILMDLD